MINRSGIYKIINKLNNVSNSTISAIITGRRYGAWS